MNWRSGLIRFSIVLTVLWAVASAYIAGSLLSGPMMAFALDPDWSEIYAETRWSYMGLAAIYWAGGAAIWWAFLYTGFWIAKGFRR